MRTELRTILTARIVRLAVCAVAAFVFGAGQLAWAQLLLDEHPAETLGAGIDERRGEQVPLDLTFKDARGRSVTLGDYFDGERPVVLVIGYYDCPLLCTLIFNGAQAGFNDIAFTLGQEYRAVSISFDHTNTTAMARERQAAAHVGYARYIEEDAWPFLTADASNARKLCESVGYRYVYMPDVDEFSHAAVIMILTPDGVISNYLYGIKYPPRQLRLALMEAADGQIGSLFDRILFYCHIWDPRKGSYVLHAFRVMQISAALTALVLGAGIGWLFFTGSRRSGARGGSLESIESHERSPGSGAATAMEG
ncbi:MAG: SCO family protein [Phycisphaeraceae bacterium]|nr:MAG: SCO family protein [Phycisphaeraceae bacterium]